MGFVGQLLEYKAHNLPKAQTKKVVNRVLRANKHLQQAVDALTKTKGRQAAIAEVIEQNPALKTALALELLKNSQPLSVLAGNRSAGIGAAAQRGFRIGYTHFAFKRGVLAPYSLTSLQLDFLLRALVQ